MPPAKAKGRFVGARLEEALEYRELNQIALEKLIRVSHGTVSRYISGERSPSADNLAALVNTLGVSLRWLMGQSADPAYVEPWQKPALTDAGAAAFESGEVDLAAHRQRVAAFVGTDEWDIYPQREIAVMAITNHGPFNPAIVAALRLLKTKEGGVNYEEFTYEDWIDEAAKIGEKMAEALQKLQRADAPRPPDTEAKPAKRGRSLRHPAGDHDHP